MHLSGADKDAYFVGKEIYYREGFCSTCHQADGNGLPMAGFPSLVGTQWVTGDPRIPVEVVLNGLMQRIWVKGEKYDGHVPMMAFRNMLNDEEVAAVVTYVRNAFGNKADAVSVDVVKEARATTPADRGFWTAPELFEKYPDVPYPDGLPEEAVQQ